MSTTRARATAAAAGIVLAIAGCGAGNNNTGSSPSSHNPGSASTTPSPRSSTPPRAAPFNSADLAFARTYVTAQVQAHAAAKLVATHAGHAQLSDVASAVGHRSHDIQHIRGWLRDWHQPADVPASRHMPGMMDADDIDEMRHMHGTRFDDDWTEHMARVDALAIAACQRELRSGANPHARQFAAQRLSTLRTERAQLLHWHDAWHGDRTDDGRHGPHDSEPSHHD